MQYLTLLAFTALATAAPTAVNTTAPEYLLKTMLKPGQAAEKECYADLYLGGYHTGAGLNDAVLYNTSDSGAKGYLQKTNITASTGGNVYNQEFDLGNDFPWGLVMVPNSVFYADWQPVELNAGASGNEFTVSGFFINKTGLQWTSSPSAIGSTSDSFGGWLVCDWWHGVPQLFFRLGYYGSAKAPSSCADVFLMPEFVGTSKKTVE